ncbi:MAG: hypothetical protein MHPSP_004609, partial [Paramarteilia canceri]
LHTAEKWVQEGKQVIKGQKAHKIVKSVQRRTPEGSEIFIELFGEWQVEPYNPGKVENVISHF